MRMGQGYAPRPNFFLYETLIRQKMGLDEEISTGGEGETQFKPIVPSTRSKEGKSGLMKNNAENEIPDQHTRSIPISFRGKKTGLITV